MNWNLRPDEALGLPETSSEHFLCLTGRQLAKSLVESHRQRLVANFAFVVQRLHLVVCGRSLLHP